MGNSRTRLDYDELIRISKQFRQKSEEIIILHHDTAQKLRALRKEWEGKAADNFFLEMEDKVMPSLDRVSKGLLRSESVLNQIMEIYREADIETASYFKALGSTQYVSSKEGAQTITLGIHNNLSQNQVEHAIETLDNLLKPIDWISDSKKATRIFEETLSNIGRFANSVTGSTGYIKEMKELGQALTGVTKVVSALSNVLTLRDYSNYFSGKLTNHEMADSAIKAMIPIPILNAKISEWFIHNMPEPNGVWRGLVTEVKSD